MASKIHSKFSLRSKMTTVIAVPLAQKLLSDRVWVPLHSPYRRPSCFNNSKNNPLPPPLRVLIVLTAFNYHPKQRRVGPRLNEQDIHPPQRAEARRHNTTNNHNNHNSPGCRRKKRQLRRGRGERVRAKPAGGRGRTGGCGAGRSG